MAPFISTHYQDLDTPDYDAMITIQINLLVVVNMLDMIACPENNFKVAIVKVDVNEVPLNAAA